MAHLFCVSLKKYITHTSFLSSKRAIKKSGLRIFRFITLFIYVFSTFAGYLLYLPQQIKPVQAASHTITSRVDFEKGQYVNTESKSKEGEVKLVPGGTWGPRVWKTPKLGLSNQTAIASDGNYIYILANYDRYFARYVPSEDRWVELAPAPHGAYNGSDLVVVGNYIYAIYGGYQRDFSRYSIINNTWEDLAYAPDLFVDGASLVSDGTYLYATHGGWTQDFWRYDPATNSWMTTLSYPPAGFQAGSDMVYKDGNIYAARGYYRNFYKYDIASNSWSNLVNIPADFYPMYANHNLGINGDYIYFTRDYSSTKTFYRYKISTDVFEPLVDLPQTTGYVGNVYNAADGYLYIFRGNGTYDFWKYDITNNIFLGPTDTPSYPGSGADLINNAGYLYYTNGRNVSNFYRYNYSSGIWDTLTNSPINFNDDTKGVNANGVLYYFQGSNTMGFYKYDTVTTTWSQLADTPLTNYYGATLTYPGTGDFIYGTRGARTRTYWRYSISGNTWSDVAVADLPDNAEAGYGARLATDGTDIYYTSGHSTAEMYKYTIATDAWSKLTNLPFAPYWGTDISFYNNKIYAQAGYFKNDFWEYSIATNMWRYLPPMQNYGYTELGPWNGGSLEQDGSGHFYSIYGMNVYRMQTFTPSNNNYLASGTWTSAPIDLTYVSSLTSLTTEAQTPGNSSLIFETRTSSDKINWSAWEMVSGGVIQSAAAQFIEIKATFTSSTDFVQTPVLEHIVINYIGDENPPTNPNAATALSTQVGGVSLTSGSSYNYAHPYFSWSGASDGESSINGYYVYFGTLPTADPITDGSFQVASSYTATTPMANGTYYLRVKTKDTSGIINSATSLFTYVYQGVSPPLQITATSSADFTSGTAVNMTIFEDQIKLASKSSFWEEQRLMYSPAGVYLGGDFAFDSTSNKLYLLRGYNTTSFYEYDIGTDIWAAKANAPNGAYYGSDLAEGPPGFLFALRGVNTSDFWRYDIANNTWSDEAAANLPQYTSYGGALMSTENGSYIYALRGNNDDAFYRYDTALNLWEQMANLDFGATANQINNLVGGGGDLAYDGNDTIYAIQGNGRTGLSAYSITGNNWTPLPNAPFLESTGSKIEYDSTTNALYFLSGNGKVFFYKFNISTQTWTELPNVPRTISYGSTLKNVSGELYVMIGGGSNLMYKYNIAKNSWLSPKVGLFGGWFRGADSRTFYYGADIIKGDDNNFYFTRGNYDNTFFRFNETTGEVSQIADAPGNFFYGAELVYDNIRNQIYATSNYYDRKFYMYDIATDTWSEITTDPPPYDPYVGSAMSFDGGQYIYWLRGNANTFYRYNITGIAGSRWEIRTNAPSTMSYGADLVYKNGYIYAVRGGTGLEFYRYDPNLNTWNDPIVANLPMGKGIYNDGFLVDGGGDKLYACRGWNTKECLSYSIANNNWELIHSVNAPYISAGGAGASNGVDKIYVIPGGAAYNTFTNGLYTLVMQTDTSSFEEVGSYISPVYDLTSVYRYANISLTYSAATNNLLKVSTRTSDDSVNWSDWTAVSEEKAIASIYTYKINSSVARYIQAKIELTSSNGIYSGSIQDYTINYYQDISAPTNPTDLSGYDSATQSASIITDAWYNHTSPNFDWPDAEASGGATDGTGGSGIAGYYVYFGTDSAADASTSGTLTTSSTYTASGLTSGSTYYLRIQTIDDDGNFSAENWQPFIYKFDSDIPSNPVTISVNPAGYTSTNSFAFTMKGATDSASLIGSYCYKYLTGVGIYSTEICLTTMESNGTATVSGVLAYDNGENNTFYVRSKDNAGNYATTYATQIYKYSGTAPSKPTNLRVTYPTGIDSNSINEFAFAWDPPESFSGAQSGLRYYYSINALPTSNNVNEIGLSDTYLSTGAYATQKGDNILYVISKDEASNLDYTNYAQVTFTADTSAPGIPRNIDISDISIKETSSWRLALSWDEPEATGSGVSSYKVYRSAVTESDCNTNYADFNYIATTGQTSYVDTGLTQTKKYYCIKACDSTNECSAVSDTVGLYPDGRWRVAPELVASQSATVKTKSAIISWSTNRTANSFVKYGKTSGTYDNEAGSSDQVTFHSIPLNSLDPGTTYYYKIVWTDEDGNTGESEELSFSTNPAPFVSSVKFARVNINSAAVTFTIKSAIKASVEYGKTLSYGSLLSISTSKSETAYTIEIPSLLEGTLYHLRIAGEDDEANVYYSDDYTFETLPTPKIIGLRVQQVVGMPTATLRLLWTTNTLVSSIVTYYPTKVPQSAIDNVSLVLKKSHEVILKNLLDDTDYTILIRGKDSAGNEAKTETRSLKTANDVRPPEMQNLNVESTIVGVGENATAQIVITWDTDEPSTTQIEYGQGTGSSYNQTTQEDINRTSNHTVTVTGLSPSKIYHLRALSKDKANNVGQSLDTVIITPKSTKDAFNLVIDNLSKTFGFLKNYSGTK